MRESLGVNTVGVYEHKQFVAGTFQNVPLTAKAFSGSGAVALPAGSVVKLNSNGTVSLVNDPEDTIWGVLPRELKPGQTGVVWVTGQFLGDQLTFGKDAGSWETWVVKARALSIFLTKSY